MDGEGGDMVPGLPPLSLTTGPAISSATSGGGAVGTGEFQFKGRAPGLIEQALPWAVLGVVVWTLWKR